MSYRDKEYYYKNRSNILHKKRIKSKDPKEKGRRADYNKRYSMANKGKIKNNMKKWYKSESGILSKRKRNLARYGITIDIYDSMLKNQNGVCKICGKKDKRLLSVDHDHKTGKVRGLLCNKCNFALGYADDNPERLRDMARYLESQETP